MNNFEGEKLDIRHCREDFEARCFEIIRLYADKLGDLDVLPVAAFVGKGTLDYLLKNLRKASYPCLLKDTPNPSHQTNNQNAIRKKPIMFFDPRRFDGCEWSTVLVLLDFRFVDENIEKDFFIAITRASMKVAIIVREFSSGKNGQIPKFCRESIAIKLKEKMSVYNQTENENKLDALVVSGSPKLLGFSKALPEETLASSLPDVKGVSLYKLKCDDSDPFFVCHVDDVFLQSDLRKLSQYGIQSIFVSHASAFHSDEYFHFYKATIDCITAGMNGKFHVCDNVSSFQKAGEQSRNLKEFLVEHSLETNVEKSVEQPRDENLPGNDCVLNWKKWKAKGVELQRLGRIDLAKICFQYSIAHLEKINTTSFLKQFERELVQLRQCLATLGEQDRSTLTEPEQPGTSH